MLLCRYGDAHREATCASKGDGVLACRLKLVMVLVDGDLAALAVRPDGHDIARADLDSLLVGVGGGDSHLLGADGLTLGIVEYGAELDVVALVDDLRGSPVANISTSDLVYARPEAFARYRAHNLDVRLARDSV